MNIKFKIISLLIFIFLIYNPIFAKSDCSDILKNRTSLNMTVGLGKMFFNGYNYAKKTNIKYSKSKFKKFIKAICRIEKNITYAEIFGRAADSNLDTSQFKLKVTEAEDSTGNLKTIDKFFINYHKHFKENPDTRKCFISHLHKDRGAVKFIELKYEELESLRTSQGEDYYKESWIDEVFQEDADLFWKFIQKTSKKCK